MNQNNPKRILIVGGVAAGATAAARARRQDENAQITLLEAGPYISFANCGLPYYLGREIKDRQELILQTPEDFSQRYNLTVHINTEAVAIDATNKVLTARRTEGRQGISEELTFHYDSLILAQGGRPIRPSLPGADQPHVHTLWTIPEMDALEQAIADESNKTAAVLGGGFIGLEMAEALRHRGMEVSVIEMAPHIMAHLDDEIAAVLEDELRDQGVSLYTGRRAEAICEDSVILDDKTEVPADIVLLSVGVAPTLQLAKNTGLAMGEGGGILVNEYLQTSDPGIFAAGDMIELTHRVTGLNQRLPLAGPANRQGRIAAANALARLSGEPLKGYSGAIGTSVVKLFGQNAASTGISMAQAKAAGIPAQAVTIHKGNHAGYYPGSRDLALKLTYRIPDGLILGAQAAGADVDKRIDVIASAITGQLTIHDLAELDLAYAPPFSSANDPVNIAAMVAQNRLSESSPAITAEELEETYDPNNDLILDVRTREEYEDGNIDGVLNIDLDELRDNLHRLPKNKRILVHCASGYRAHLALRILQQRGYTRVLNILGGFTSIERHAKVRPYSALTINFSQGLVSSPCMASAPSMDDLLSQAGTPSQGDSNAPSSSQTASDTPDPLVVDVRTPEEFAMRAYPGALNIPLNELPSRYTELQPQNRQIIVYCASGARSSYAQMLLGQLGFTQVENGGSLMEMLSHNRR